MLYTHWKERKLCRSVLKDFALGEDPELYFKRSPDGGFTDDYGPHCTVESWFPVSPSSGYDVGIRASTKRSLRRSTSTRLKKARIGITKTPEAPLVPGEPRAMVVVPFAWLVVVLDRYVRLVSSLVGRWRALVFPPVFVLFHLSRVTDV